MELIDAFDVSELSIVVEEKMCDKKTEWEMSERRKFIRQILLAEEQKNMAEESKNMNSVSYYFLDGRHYGIFVYW